MVNDTRGQVILLAAVLVAVIFVSLAFVVNAAISTDTVSIEGIDDVRDDDALQIQQEVRHATKEALKSTTSLNEFKSSLSEIDESIRAQYAHGDRYVIVEFVSATYPASPPSATVKFTYYTPQTEYITEIQVNA